MKTASHSPSRGTRTALIAVTTALVGGCGLFGAVFVKPGATVDLVAGSANQVTYEYTHSYDSELPFAGREAERHCGSFGRHAELGTIVKKNIDRSLVTFHCR